MQENSFHFLKYRIIALVQKLAQHFFIFVIIHYLLYLSNMTLINKLNKTGDNEHTW